MPFKKEKRKKKEGGAKGREGKKKNVFVWEQF